MSQPERPANPWWIDATLVLVLFGVLLILFVPWDGIRRAFNNGD